MFGAAIAEIRGRSFVCQRLLAIIQGLDQAKSIESSAFKGLMFVQLYGVYEHAVNSAVQSAISTIRDDQLSPSQLHHRLLTLVLDAEFMAVVDTGRSKTWSRRLELVERFEDRSEFSSLSNTIFPADGSHYRIKQLRTIWEIFGLTVPVVPEQRLLGRVDELVENRNAIAHGRRTPEDVGSRYSVGEIAKTITDVEMIATHIVESIERHCIDGGLRR